MDKVFLKDAEDTAYEMYEKLVNEYEDIDNVTNDDESDEAYEVTTAYSEATSALYELFSALRNYNENRN